MDSSAEHVQKQVKMYIVVLISLAVLTGLTVWVASWELAIVPAVILAMVIASIKGTMVASVFMHLLHERAVIFGILILTLLFFVALLFLPVVTSSHDYAYGIVPMEPKDHFKDAGHGHGGGHDDGAHDDKGGSAGHEDDHAGDSEDHGDDH